MKRITLLLVSFLLLVSLAPAVSGQGNNAGWKAGVAKVRITPESGIWMAGYAARTKPSEGTMHDLWAKALFLEDSLGNQGLLVTTDLLGFSKTLADRILDRLKTEHGLAKAQVILNSSHTHSGPVLSNALRDIYPLDENQKEKVEFYSDWLVSQIAGLAGKAKRSAQPANLYSGNGVVRFQVNRRNNMDSQLTKLTELKGPNDYAVPVLKIENKNGKIKVVVFGYACHPTVLSGYEWSGDYPGFAQLELEKRYRGAAAMFFQGAGADQNPLPRRSVSLANQYGLELAAAVDRTLNEEMKRLRPKLTVAYSEIDLELEDPPAKEELMKLVNDTVYYRKTWSKRLLDTLESGKPAIKNYPYPVQFWQLGSQGIASLGGELLIGYSNNLKKILGDDLFVMGYSNDVMAYIPTERVLREGGYEGESSQMVYGLPSVWKSGLEKRIIDEVVGLAGESGKAPDESVKKDYLTARGYFSGFEQAHDSYNSISCASDGKIYYVLSSQEYDKAGQLFFYDPQKDSTEWLGDLTELCGEKGKNAISQGKSHTRFYECDGKLYFSTHVGFYEMIDGMECLPVHAPEGFGLYPGGHFLSYDLTKKKFEDLAMAPAGEGILTMTMDRERRQIYGITWPSGYFIHYDVENHTLKNAGKVSENGEAGRVGQDYRVLCRSMFVDPRDGKVYYSTSEGFIFYYDPVEQAIKKVEDVSLRLDYFGKYDHTKPGSMAYNWRAIVWDPKGKVAWGVHGNSGYLFRFDPGGKTLEIIDRITSDLSRKSGMFDQFSYGYLGFDLGPDRKTLYYLTGGPIYIDGMRVKGVDEIAMGAARGLENLHLVTYNVVTNEFKDHGPVYYKDGSRPTYVNSIAIDKNGNVYALARFEHNGKLIQDLIKIRDPFKND